MSAESNYLKSPINLTRLNSQEDTRCTEECTVPWRGLATRPPDSRQAAGSAGGRLSREPCRLTRAGPAVLRVPRGPRSPRLPSVSRCGPASREHCRLSTEVSPGWLMQPLDSKLACELGSGISSPRRRHPRSAGIQGSHSLAGNQAERVPAGRPRPQPVWP